MIPLVILAIESPEDREFMTVLYKKYYRLMYWQIYQIIDNPWDADEVLQESVIKLIRKIDELKKKDKNRLVVYIIVTCRNCAINYAVKSARIKEFEFYDLDGVSVNGNPPETQLILEEEYQELLAAWKEMDMKTRYLLEAKYVLQKSNEEIAKELNIKPNSVRMYLSRARNKLKAKIKNREQII